jgi:hypothetical protein
MAGVNCHILGGPRHGAGERGHCEIGEGGYCPNLRCRANLSRAAPAVDHAQLSAQFSRVAVASVGLVIESPLVVEIA